MSSILNMIRDADRGQLMEDANTAIGDILEAIQADYERTGEITIKIKLSTKNGVVQILPSLDSKLSKPERNPTQMFLSEDGSLSRRDPRQPVMSSVAEADEVNRRRSERQQRED